MGLLDRDAVRIGGKMYTRNRAIAIGLIVAGKGADYVLTPKGVALLDTQGARKVRQAAAAASWRARQGLPPLEPATTVDGILKPEGKPKVLRPKNVTKAGAEVTDEATLAKIAAESDDKAKAFAAAVAEGDPADG